jgi:hypothetical protein
MHSSSAPAAYANCANRADTPAPHPTESSPTSRRTVLPVKCEKRSRVDLEASCPANRFRRGDAVDRKSAEPGRGSALDRSPGRSAYAAADSKARARRTAACARRSCRARAVGVLVASVDYRPGACAAVEDRAVGRGRAATGEIAARLNLHRNTVAKWRRRFEAERLDGLVDEPRPGQPRTITDGWSMR